MRVTVTCTRVRVRLGDEGDGYLDKMAWPKTRDRLADAKTQFIRRREARAWAWGGGGGRGDGGGFGLQLVRVSPQPDPELSLLHTLA